MLDFRTSLRKFLSKLISIRVLHFIAQFTGCVRVLIADSLNRSRELTRLTPRS